MITTDFTVIDSIWLNRLVRSESAFLFNDNFTVTECPVSLEYSNMQKNTSGRRAASNRSQETCAIL